MFGLGTFTTGAEPFPGLVVHGQVLDLRPELVVGARITGVLERADDDLLEVAEVVGSGAQDLARGLDRRQRPQLREWDPWAVRGGELAQSHQGRVPALHGQVGLTSSG